MKKDQKDHTKLICDISEISGLFQDSSTLETFLQKIVEMIADHMHSDVCSIYLLNEHKGELELRATHGLNADFIGKVTLKLGEGLTGLALKELRPICERNASQNANFRYFPGLGEEKFESFLAVPIIRGTTRIGAMVIQNTQKNYFVEDDIKILKAITTQLANTIELAKLILSIEEKPAVPSEEKPAPHLKFIKGKVGAPGFAYAESIILSESQLSLSDNLSTWPALTVSDFHQALGITEQELKTLQEQIEEKLSDVASMIFTAQILMLKDKAFVDAIDHLIAQGLNPPLAVMQVVKEYMRRFENLPDEYLREKSHDIRDIGYRLLKNLLGRQNETLDYGGRIVVARELFPSDILKLSSQNIKGVILLSGGVTSHLSILAQSLQIPLLIADIAGLLDLPARTKILMDADQGNIYIDPGEEIIRSFKNKIDDHLGILKSRDDVTDATYTQDGTQVHLSANINLLGDVKYAHMFKAEGIGLYRTEFPFIVRSNFPGEEEQLIIYKKLIDSFPGKPVTFRTLDIGGDKVLSYFDHHSKERNPYLGLRSIRFSLSHIDIFSQQIRAILRAGVSAELRIMFPMISSLDEFQRAKGVVLQCMKELKKEKIPCHRLPQIGMMVEIPAILEIIDDLAQEADFMSIGTNDFIQYMLAVDRSNEKVADLYLPQHPAILRALKTIVDAARKYKKEVSVCGDMAHEEKFLPYFLGIGIRSLSINPTYLPKMQAAITKIHLPKAEALTQAILKEKHLKEINRLLGIPAKS